MAELPIAIPEGSEGQLLLKQVYAFASSIGAAVEVWGRPRIVVASDKTAEELQALWEQFRATPPAQ